MDQVIARRAPQVLDIAGDENQIVNPRSRGERQIPPILVLRPKHSGPFPNDASVYRNDPVRIRFLDCSDRLEQVCCPFRSRRFNISAPRRFSKSVAALRRRSESSPVPSHLRTFALPRAPNSRSTFSSIRYAVTESGAAQPCPPRLLHRTRRGPLAPQAPASGSARDRGVLALDTSWYILSRPQPDRA